MSNKATNARSQAIEATIVSHLASNGETSIKDLAALTGSHPNTLATSRQLYNMRLSVEGYPSRIHSSLVRNRAFWYLRPVTRKPVNP